MILLRERKTLSPKFAALEQDCQEQQRQLNDRWNREEEERKRKADEEEENKFDFTSLLMESKRPANRKTVK